MQASKLKSDISCNYKPSMEFFSIISIQISEMLRFCRFYVIHENALQMSILVHFNVKYDIFLSENKWTER